MSKHILHSRESIRVDHFLRDFLHDRLDGRIFPGRGRGAPLFVDLILDKGADGFVETPPDVTDDFVFVERIVAFFETQDHILHLVECFRLSESEN